MRRYYYLFFFACFTSTLIFSQDQQIIEQARLLFENKKYSAAQSVLSQLTNASRTPESMYLDARCSKELYMSDAIALYNDLNETFPNNLYENTVYGDIADIYYRNKNYIKSIQYLENVKHLSDENTFKLAYSNFNIDSLEKAQYFFSKIMNTKSKFSKPAKYYYAYISYEKKLYNSALQNFLELETDKNFGKIAPYYICQIYFYKEDYQNLISYAQPLLQNLIPERKEEIFRLLAEAYYRTEDYKNAITFFRKTQNEDKNLDPNMSFMLGHSFYNTGQYEYAILNLENVASASDSILQFVYYYLGASYIKFEYYTYALNAFKKSASYDNNLAIQEDALFNYAKLSYQLNLPFDNTFNVFKTYLTSSENAEKKAYINSLMIKMFESTNMYSNVYALLIDLDTLSIEQKKSLQRASFYLGLEQYNKQDFKKATLYFRESIKHSFNEQFTYLSNFWLYDCLYNLSDFSQAIEGYNNLPNTSSKYLSDFKILKKYNLAYSYFKIKDYQSSVKWFRSYLKASKDSMRINDSYLRLADSYFMLKKYSTALKYYQKSTSINLFDIDYALYQSSVTASLVNNDLKQLNCLNNLVSNHKNSTYYLLAVKDLANYYKVNSNFEFANKYYKILIDSSKNRDWIADAYLSVGNILLQLDSIDQAVFQFLIVVNNYADTKYFKQALSSLQFSYSQLDKIDDYIALIESLPEYNITVSEQDSILYNSAYIKYIEKDYVSAKQSFEKYLNRFEKGIFHDKVLYYTAVSSINLEDTLSAISYYERILLGNFFNNYKEEALIFLSRYYFSKNDYQKSNVFYLELQKIVSSSLIKREVIIKLMQGYENIDLIQSSLYAEKVFELEKVDVFLLSKATLILARSEFNLGNYAKCKSTFSKVKSYKINDHSCEAMYYVAYLNYLEDSLKLSEEQIFDLVKKYSNKYFIAKSLILLADIYIDLNKTFQAKATLESVIDNYKGLDLVNEAIRKMEFIIAKEKEDAIQQKKEQTFIEIMDDDFDYEIQEIDENYVVEGLNQNNIVNDSINININILENEFE
tara:strand:- start:27173 stop:30283 length:3111 start_codon:yes stop_codon:yes gene_type:complete